jgi:hypothetical protein
VVEVQGEFEMIRKEYISWYERDGSPNEDRGITYHFCNDPNDAAYWLSRESAEIDCRSLNRSGVVIPYGGTYVCTNFQTEEQAPDKFRIYCEARFDPSQRGSYLTRKTI